ncbi:hypothetical protein [Streptomyces sp. NPDC126514]|uniref:hypothetical protein n=1 Tax=Streptomyces sp. NPDC126514 TaxID=3155210 RepID=UPI00333268B2
MADTAQLTATAAVPGSGQAAVERLHESTHGHPLHLHSLRTQTTPGELADLAQPLPVPASLDAVVRSILDRLPEDSRHLVEALAVLGTTTQLATAAQLAS